MLTCDFVVAKISKSKLLELLFPSICVLYNKMPRVRRYRSKAVYYPKQKWSKQFTLMAVSGGNPVSVIAQNSQAVAVPAPSLITVGNIKVKGDVYIPNVTITSANYCFVAITYVPEGITLSNSGDVGSFWEKHAEYCMGWTVIALGTGADDSTNSFTISSRLKRRLQAGDRIVLMLYTNLSGVFAQCNTEYYTHAN